MPKSKDQQLLELEQKILLQQRAFALEPAGFQAIKHQSFVGTGYFDAIQDTVQQGKSSTTAMKDSTETEQFK